MIPPSAPRGLRRISTWLRANFSVVLVGLFLTSPCWVFGVSWCEVSRDQAAKDAAERRVCAADPCACSEFTQHLPELHDLNERHGRELLEFLDRQERQEIEFKYRQDAAELKMRTRLRNGDENAVDEWATRQKDAAMKFMERQASEIEQFGARQGRELRATCEAALRQDPTLRPSP